MTVVRLKEEGKFRGILKGYGYVYELLGKYYAIGSDGLKQLTV